MSWSPFPVLTTNVFHWLPICSVNFTVTWMELAKVKVTKKDDATGVNLAGAVFGIYSDKGCTNLITKMPETDAQGATEVQIPKTQSTVYLKEISVPQGYKLSNHIPCIMDLCNLILAVNIFCRINRIFCTCIRSILINKI